jgi:hypothetical protein
LLSPTTQYTTSKEAVRLNPIQGGREEIPGSSKAMPSSIAIRGAKNDAKDGKKRRPQWAATTISYDRTTLEKRGLSSKNILGDS